VEASPSPAVSLDQFGVDVSCTDGHAVVRVAGEVDMYTAPVLARRLFDLIDEGARDVVVDLASMSFIDSTGLTALVRGLARLRAHDGRLVLRSPQPNVGRVLEITGLNRVLLGD